MELASAVNLLLEKSFFSSSSSSSSDSSSSDDEKSKTKGFVDGVLIRYKDDQFKEYFRLSRSSFEDLLKVLATDYKHIRRPPAPLNECLLSALWFLATQESYRNVAARFGFSRGHLHTIVKKMCKLLTSKIAHYIVWPQKENALETVQSFNEGRGSNSFPGVIGCIDGTHIRIPDPINNNSYYTKKGMYAIHLQAVCNSKQQFIDIFCGWPGSAHDATVWENSPLYHAIESGIIKLPENSYILGDTAYPLTPYLMVPYRDNGHLTHRQKIFNKKLHDNRILIESAFCHLKGMFQRLEFLDVKNLAYAKDIIVSCCILHNLALKDCDDLDIIVNKHDEDEEEEEEEDYFEHQVSFEGRSLRNEILNTIS